MIKAINTTSSNNPPLTQKHASDIYFSVPTVALPQGERKYTLFNQNKVGFIVSQKELSLPYLKEVLQKSNDEKEIVEALYILNKLADNKVKGIPAMYPLLEKFNNTDSPNIQAFLAGVYRKTQVPDAFGPLCAMLMRNSAKPVDKSQTTDPNEEIGGAILAYIENYSHNPPKIDFSA